MLKTKRLGFVGWVERSETHPPVGAEKMGFALLNPSYGRIA